MDNCWSYARVRACGTPDFACHLSPEHLYKKGSEDINPSDSNRSESGQCGQAKRGRRRAGIKSCQAKRGSWTTTGLGAGRYLFEGPPDTQGKLRLFSGEESR